ncbi:hypothetical protein DPM13_15330 [Paracoccus mutanolyticus]|uniref:Uncharacterized protein n=1 Tax=Paracoccus mutanolyticus TaxID=1499308 RepID=A0ABN5MCB9_9RHOB|nr:hypothetical protein [Paracoccus mutanolyticus]AWX93905.1 hypothetical protein DPM13_15330 [Paracoccus mutanolyticus]
MTRKGLLLTAATILAMGGGRASPRPRIAIALSKADILIGPGNQLAPRPSGNFGDVEIIYTGPTDTTADDSADADRGLRICWAGRAGLLLAGLA